MDWLHIGAERWNSTPPEVRLRAIVQRDPLLLWPAAHSLAAHVGEEAYAALRSAITESVPPVPYGLSPDEDLDISLQLHLASEKPDKTYREQQLFQKEKFANAGKGATPPKAVEITVPPSMSPAAKHQQGADVTEKALSIPSQKREEHATSPSIKIVDKLAQIPATVPPGKKGCATKEDEASPKFSKQPTPSAEKKMDAVAQSKKTVGPPVSKKTPSKGPAPPGADMKTVGVAGFSRTLKSPQAPVDRQFTEKETEAKGSLGVPPRATAKLALGTLAKGGEEKEPSELVAGKVVIPPPTGGVLEVGAEPVIESKAISVGAEETTAQPKGLSVAAKKSFPSKKDQAEKAAEMPRAACKAEEQALKLENAKESGKAAGKKAETTGVVASAGDKSTFKTAPPLTAEKGGPIAKGPLATKAFAAAPPVEKKDETPAGGNGDGKQSTPKKTAPPKKQSVVLQDAGEKVAPGVIHPEKFGLPTKAFAAAPPVEKKDETPAGGNGDGKQSTPKKTAPPKKQSVVLQDAGEKVAPGVIHPEKFGLPTKAFAAAPPVEKEDETPAGGNGDGKQSTPKKTAPPKKQSVVLQDAGEKVAPGVIHPEKFGLPLREESPAAGEADRGEGKKDMSKTPPPAGKSLLASQVAGVEEKKEPAVLRAKKSEMPPPTGLPAAVEKELRDVTEDMPKKPSGKAGVMPQVAGGDEGRGVSAASRTKKLGMPPPKGPPPAREKDSGDSKEERFKEPPPAGQPSPMPQSNGGAEGEKVSDVVSSKKLSLPPTKKLPRPAKASLLDAPAEKMTESPRGRAANDETSANSTLAAVEDTVTKGPPIFKKVIPKVEKSTLGGPTPAGVGEAQHQEAGTQPGKPPPSKKGPSLPPKKTAPPTIPPKKSAPLPT